MEQYATAAQETPNPGHVTRIMGLDSIFCQAMKPCMGTTILGNKFWEGIHKPNNFLQAGLVEGVLAHGKGVETRRSLQIPSNPDHSVVL